MPAQRHTFRTHTHACTQAYIHNTHTHTRQRNTRTNTHPALHSLMSSSVVLAWPVSGASTSPNRICMHINISMRRNSDTHSGDEYRSRSACKGSCCFLQMQVHEQSQILQLIQTDTHIEAFLTHTHTHKHTHTHTQLSERGHQSVTEQPQLC
jgi:hypothetical protein